MHTHDVERHGFNTVGPLIAFVMAGIAACLLPACSDEPGNGTNGGAAAEGSNQQSADLFTSGNTLPAAVMDEDVDCVVYFNLTEASVEQVDAALETIHDAIPSDVRTRRTRALAGRLRHEVGSMYEQMRSAFMDVGVKDVAFVIAGREGRSFGPASTPEFITLVRVQEGTAANDLINAAEQMFGEMDGRERSQIISNIRKYDEQWIAFAGDGDLDNIGGDPMLARAWSQQLNDAPPGALRIAMRMDVAMAEKMYKGQRMVALEIDNSDLATNAKDVFVDLDQVSISVQLGESPRVVSRLWFMSEPSAAKAVDMLDAQFDLAKEIVQPAPEVRMAGLQSAGPEKVDAIRSATSIEQNGQSIDVTMSWDALRPLVELFSRRHEAWRMLRDLDYALNVEDPGRVID